MNDNIFSITGGKGNKPTETTETIPTNKYVIEDIEGNEYPAEGFLIFTSQHVAVMKDTGTGAVPILIIPLDRLKVAELYEDDEEESELPF